MGRSALTGKRVTLQVPSPINDHNKTCKSEIQETDFSILCRDSISEYRLQVKETLFIHRDKPKINTQGGSVPMKLFKG